MSEENKKVADYPAVSWFVYALTQDIAYVTWDGKGQPTRHSIPPGPVLDLEQGKYVIICDSEYTRSLVTELARMYAEMEKNYHRLQREERAAAWRPASELPPGAGGHSSKRYHRALVTSPVLHYLVGDGITEGWFNMHTGKWSVRLGDQMIEHRISHWRDLPPSPEPAPPYEQVAEEAEALRAKMKG